MAPPKMLSSVPVIRVAIVEDRKEEIECLRTLLSSEQGFCCAGVCHSAEEACETLPKLKVDIVLMDIHLPKKSGIECLREVEPRMSGTQFMMLTVIEDHAAIYESLKAGATGYLLKKTPGSKILDAIRELKAGGAPMSGQIARKVIAAFQGNSNPSRKRAATVHKAEPAALSENEHKVLNLLGRGMLYKEVAEALGISMGTVRTHVWHIYRKLQVNNRTEALNRGRAISARV